MATEIKRTRRDFLKCGGMALAGLMAVIVPIGGSLYIEANTPERDKKIEQVQKSLRNLEEQGKVKYIDGQGYVFNLPVDGQTVTTHVSREDFNAGHKFTFKPNSNFTVRASLGNEIEVYQNSDRVYDPKTIERMQAMTNKVLEALVAQTSPSK